jgi:hypothetical protein
MTVSSSSLARNYPSLRDNERLQPTVAEGFPLYRGNSLSSIGMLRIALLIKCLKDIVFDMPSDFSYSP